MFYNALLFSDMGDVSYQTQVHREIQRAVALPTKCARVRVRVDYKCMAEQQRLDTQPVRRIGC